MQTNEDSGAAVSGVTGAITLASTMALPLAIESSPSLALPIAALGAICAAATLVIAAIRSVA